jgi:7-carboxy-7-deazaguanine synthase
LITKNVGKNSEFRIPNSEFTLYRISMFIAETFTSLQGEGMLTGVPSFFIRTSGCNLRCRWCDTPYTSWVPEGERRPVADLVEEALASGVRHVVVTGGEPLLQREIGALTGGLHEARLHVTVETAGTVDPAFHCDLLSVSPKTSNSDPPGAARNRHRRLRGDRGPLIRLLRRFPEHQLKFVVDDADDLPEVIDVLASIDGADPARVLLMAQGRTVEEVALRAPAVAALCLEHGFRYTPRLHLDLFGGGRGV